MTCIVALQSKKGILHFASDRRVTSGDQILNVNEPKTVYRNGVILAGAGSAWLSDLVILDYTFPVFNNSYHIGCYARDVFVRDLTTWLKKEGHWSPNTGLKRDNIEPESASILVGLYDEVYDLNMCFDGISILKVSTPYAIGCGAPYALGSILTTERFKMSIHNRLRLACDIAAELSSACDSRLDIVTNKDLF